MKFCDLTIHYACAEAEFLYANPANLAYQTEGSSGFDLRAISVTDKGLKYQLNHANDGLELGKQMGILEQFTLLPNKRALFGTGLIMAVPQGYEIQVRSRSGLALKNGVHVLNAPGTIDSDYRGEVGIILHNSSSEPFVIQFGDRIAQAVVAQTIRANFIIKPLPQTENTARGEGGFGSTGVK